MVQGFVVEHMQAGAAAVEAWVEGPPKVSVWTGLKLPLLGKLPVAILRPQGIQGEIACVSAFARC